MAFRQGRPTGLRRGYLKCPAGSHVVWFRDRGDRIEVIRIPHGRQDPGRHLRTRP